MKTLLVPPLVALLIASASIRAEPMPRPTKTAPPFQRSLPDRRNLTADRAPAANDAVSVVGNLQSGSPLLDADGRRVLFVSDADTLVSNDNNGAADIFLWDVQAGTNELISINAAGATGGNNSSWGAFLTPDARRVTFVSDASDLVPGDTNGLTDVFLRDRESGTTRLVSANTNGAPGNAVSWSPRLSADGRFVAFQSWADDLVASDTNQEADIFVRDMAGGTTVLVSVRHDGTRSGDDESDLPLVISPDGRFVVFESAASDLVSGVSNEVDELFVRDLLTGVTGFLAPAYDGGAPSPGFSQDPAFSADGRYVVFSSTCYNLVPNDSNNAEDVFVRDLVEGVTVLVSVNDSGTGSGNGRSFHPSLSANGRYVAFESDAADLVPRDTNGAPDVFVRDLWTGVTTLESRNPAGTAPGNDWSYSPTLSADGRFVAFDSLATNLTSASVPANSINVFIRDRLLDATILASTNLAGAGGTASDNAPVGWPLLSADGGTVAFECGTSNLPSEDPALVRDIVVVRSVAASTNADLEVGLSADPGSAAIGATVTYTTTVTNGGPASATDVCVTFWLPPGGVFLSASSSSGHSEAMNGAAVVNLGTLSAGASGRLTVQAFVNLAGPLLSSASAVAAEPDLNPANNHARVGTVVTNGDAGPQLRLTALSNQRLDISWPASFTGFVLYETASLSPPVNWQPTSNQVQLINGAFSVSLPIGGGSRFYRLVQSAP